MRRLNVHIDMPWLYMCLWTLTVGVSVLALAAGEDYLWIASAGLGLVSVMEVMPNTVASRRRTSILVIEYIGVAAVYYAVSASCSMLVKQLTH